MSNIIDLSGYVLVPRERLRQLEDLETRTNINTKIDLDLSTFNWPPKPPTDAPEPKITPDYTVNFYNDMGHLGYDFKPKFTGKDNFILNILPYSSQDIRDVYKNKDGCCLTFLKLKSGSPMKRNVSVKLDDAWVTVCLDYTSLDHHIEE